ncbi:HAD hydrolase-like protein [Candidatus Pacearchaeota archaeon]|nr:HAD hydrolase-like protein [Candidatus Pacearchaeota archaeon]
MVNLIAFDCDGVLRDESESYTRCIAETVAFFDNNIFATTEELNESIKESNDDWERTHRILQQRGVFVDFGIVKEHFQDLYLGKKINFSGYINNEPWLVDNNLLGQLIKRYILIIVSGAPIDEVKYALKKNNAEKYFQLILGMNECKSKKDGLHFAIEKFKPKKVFFCDDRPSPIKSVKELGNMTNAYGILPPVYDIGWKEILLDSGAEKVFDDVNDYCKFLIELK